MLAIQALCCIMKEVSSHERRCPFHVLVVACATFHVVVGALALLVATALLVPEHRFAW